MTLTDADLDRLEGESAEKRRIAAVRRNFQHHENADDLEREASDTEALIAEVRQCRAEGAWRPIGEAPRDGTMVLLYSPDAAYPQIFMGQWILFGDPTLPNEGGWMDPWQSSEWPIDAEPTRWQPLPSPPRSEP